MKLDELLESRHIPFERLHHRPAYTANRVAQTLHVPGKEMAKTVLLRTGRSYVVAVLPATHQVDLEQVRQQLGEERVEMAAESDMDRLFPDCDRTTAAWAFAQFRPQARLDLHAGELRPSDVAIACRRDAAVDPDSFAGVAPRVVELDAGHFPMFTYPRELVDALEEVSLVRPAGETDQRRRGDS